MLSPVIEVFADVAAAVIDVEAEDEEGEDGEDVKETAVVVPDFEVVEEDYSYYFGNFAGGYFLGVCKVDNV